MLQAHPQQRSGPGVAGGSIRGWRGPKIAPVLTHAREACCHLCLQIAKRCDLFPEMRVNDGCTRKDPVKALCWAEGVSARSPVQPGTHPAC